MSKIIKAGQEVNIREVASFSVTAKAKGIDNAIPEDLMPAAQTLFSKVLIHILEKYNTIVITSWYRSPALNKIISRVGSTSQHLKGYAVDFVVLGKDTQEVFEWLKYNLKDFDQLIVEKSKTSSWIHVSYVSEEKNRQEAFKLTNQ